MRIGGWVAGGLLVSLTLVACDGDTHRASPPTARHAAALDTIPSDDLTQRWLGQTQFESLMDVWGWGPLVAAAWEDGAGTRREVEEADVFHHDESRELLYILNTYRGLQVLDVSQPDAPVLVGRADLGGIPVEMFLRDTHAYVILNSFQAPRDQAPGSEYEGALLAVYDMGNPAEPQLTAQFKISGYVMGSRLLAGAGGATIYVMSNLYESSYEVAQDGEGHWEFSESSFVMSIDISDPLAPHEVDRVEFPGAGHAVHVTPQAMYVTSDDWQIEQSPIRYVDISDLGGDIVVRGTISVDGTLAWGELGNRQLDEHQGVLRVATTVDIGENGTFEPIVRITTIDVANPDDLQVLGTLDVGEGHRIVAARFEGEAAYLFHMVNVDPLEIINLSDPHHPVSAGLLEIAGWVTHIEVRGDKLVTLGVDSADERKLAMILFDVSNPSAPLELDRAVVGQGWTWTQASHDPKAFRLLDALGLALLPVESWYQDENGFRFEQWIQLFSYDLEAGEVSARGVIDDIAARRAFVVEDRVVAFSDEELKVVDVTSLDTPQVIAEVELARDVVDYLRFGIHGALIVSDGDDGNPTTEVRIVPADDPDGEAVLARLAFDGAPGQALVLDQDTLVVGGNDRTGGMFIRVVDLTNPLAPSLVGELRAPEVQTYIGRWGSELLIVGNALAFVEQRWEEATGATTQVRIVNLEDRTSPELLPAIESAVGGVFAGVMASGEQLYVSSYRNVGVTPPKPGTQAAGDIFTSQRVTYSLEIIDLRDPEAPETIEPVSVPGPLRATVQLGFEPLTFDVLYTEDRWAEGRAFDSLLLVHGAAVLLDLFTLPQGAGEVRVEASVAAFVVAPARIWLPLSHDVAPAPGSSDRKLTLTALDLSTTGLIYEGDSTEIENVDYGQLSALEDLYAFVSVGWNELHVLDVIDPYDITVVTTDTIPGWFSGLIRVPFDGNAYIPIGMFGLHVLPLR